MKGTNLKYFNNSWYKPGSIIKRFTWYIVNILFFNTYLLWPNKFKVYLLIVFGAKTGGGINIKPKVNIKYPWFLEIGNYVWIGENVWIDNLGRVKIGNNVSISQGAMLLTGNHNYRKRNFDLIIREITLEDGVWIGAKAVVCPGVIMHSHSILTVGSVITKDAEPYTIYQGNPAVAIKKREIED